MRRITIMLLVVLLTGSIGYYLLENAAELREILGRIDPLTVALVLLLRLADLSLTVAAAVRVLTERAPGLGFSEYFVVSTAGVFAGYVAPGGSTASRAVYLNRRHGVPLLTFACPDSTGSLRGIPAAQLPERGRPAWITAAFTPPPAETRILVAGLSRTFSEVFDGPRLTT